MGGQGRLLGGDDILRRPEGGERASQGRGAEEMGARGADRESGQRLRAGSSVACVMQGPGGGRCHSSRGVRGQPVVHTAPSCLLEKDPFLVNEYVIRQR